MTPEMELNELVEKWKEDPLLFTNEGISYLKDKVKDIKTQEELCYAKFLLNTYLESGDILGAYDVLKIITENPILKFYLQTYYSLFKEYSDTIEEPLVACSMLFDAEKDAAYKESLRMELASLYKESGNHEKAFDLLEDILEKMDSVMLAQTYLFSEIPEKIEIGKGLVSKLDCQELEKKLDPKFVQAGSLKFYAGHVYDGLIYHFGGEDFRPQNFVSKKKIPNGITHNFNGQSVVITPYRGMGDSMILSRMIPKFIKKFPECKITIATEKPLIPLYKEIEGIHHVGDMESCAGMVFDHCLGVNMLSRYLREQLVDENDNCHYHEWVKYPESYDSKWKEKLGSTECLVGINWKGSQQLGGTGSGIRNKNTSRDVDLTDFIGIIECNPEKTYVCLNPDITTEEKSILQNYENVIIPTGIRNFADTAAIIKMCKAVVSIDTSISTLSASLSVKTIVLAKFWPDYRWLYSEKWWDPNKVEVIVHRKPTNKSAWALPLLKVSNELRKIS